MVVVFYLFCLPFLGQFVTQIHHITHRSLVYWICIILEYFLTVCPMLFDWLIAYVAVERCINIRQGVSFQKTKSV
ncbi:hypothetical protein I4U23_031488 [Adineta vaga]|nr:hypothetical protein I4U23_031488 [Adineta vaga]